MRAWEANGAIMEDILTNLCSEQAVLRERCPTCGFHFPVLPGQPASFAAFKDPVAKAVRAMEPRANGQPRSRSRCRRGLSPYCLENSRLKKA